MAEPIRNAFGLDFAEQIEFFRKKLNLPTQWYDDILSRAHARAFVVAGAMKADLLDDLRRAVAPLQGQSLEQFRKQFLDIAKRRGWTGWTGESTAEGRAWRTRLIYETNITTSYAAGQRAQLTDADVVKRRPYWRYIHTDLAAKPRPLHVSWHGLTLRHDHSFWKTHFPPNGYFCHCRVEALREVPPGATTEPPPGWDVRDARGNLPGIDHGFDYAPGAEPMEELRDFAAAKAARLPEELSDAFSSDIKDVLGTPPWNDPLPDMAPTVPVPDVPRRKIAAPKTLDDFIAEGTRLSKRLPDAKDPEALQRAIKNLLSRIDGEKSPPINVPGGTAGVHVSVAIAAFPESWVKKARATIPLEAKIGTDDRGDYDYDGFISTVTLNPKSAHAYATAIHESTHWLQSAFPELNEHFVTLHRRRTQGDPLEKLKNLLPGKGYKDDEVTRKDHYIGPYFGKEYNVDKAYNGDPREVMPMAMETLLGVDYATTARPMVRIRALEELQKLYNQDRELFNLTLGLLLRWKP